MKSSAKLEHALPCPSGFYAALVGKCLPTFLYILTAPPFNGQAVKGEWTVWPLKIGQMSLSETSVSNYQPTLA
jgi:hypothetical protein